MPGSTLPAGLLGLLNQGRILPFLGAGASMDPPARLPSAQELADQLADLGYGAHGDSLEDVAEYCYGAGGAELFARSLPLAEWDSREPNGLHALLAELGIEGLLTHVLTTNWDSMIEHAMQRLGLPVSEVTSPSDLQLALPGAVLVVKLHGSPRFPSTLRARKADVDAPEWAEDWVGALASSLILGRSILFVGYAGSSSATTKTIERLMSAGRAGPDFVVTRRGYEGLAGSGTGRDLLQALDATADVVAGATAVEFAELLREGMYPLLLVRARDDAINLAANLTKDTRVAPAELREQVVALFDEWIRAGDRTGRGSLAIALAWAPGAYLPLVPNRSKIAMLWLWLAIVTWAGAVRLGPKPAAPLREAVTSDDAILVAVCDGRRRDECAFAAVRALSAMAQAPSVSATGFAIGGIGPLPSRTSPTSVVRGTPEPDVVRGGAASITWQSASGVFETFATDVPSDVIKQRVADLIGQLSRPAA